MDNYMEEFSIPKKLIDLMAIMLDNIKLRFYYKLTDHFETFEANVTERTIIDATF